MSFFQRLFQPKRKSLEQILQEASPNERTFVENTVGAAGITQQSKNFDETVRRLVLAYKMRLFETMLDGLGSHASEYNQLTDPQAQASFRQEHFPNSEQKFREQIELLQTECVAALRSGKSLPYS